MNETSRQVSLTATGSRKRSPTNPLIKLLRAAISSGDSFRDYQTRCVLSVAAAAILLCLPTLAVDLLHGNLELVLVTGLGGIAMIIAMGMLLLYGKMEAASHIVLLTLFVMMVALLVAKQGVTLGFYVGIAALIFLASFLATRLVAICYAFACIALLCVAAWLSHSYWQTVIDLTDPVVAVGALRIALIVVIFHLLSMMLLRDSTREMFEQMQAKKTEVARLNEQLAQAITEKQAWLQALGGIHGAGLAIAWRYDSATGRLQHSVPLQSGGDTAALLQSITESERRQLDSQCWQAKIIDAIESAAVRPHSWSREIRCVDPQTNGIRWYAVSAEMEMGKKGGVQVVGLLRDITDARTAEERQRSPGAGSMS